MKKNNHLVSKGERLGKPFLSVDLEESWYKKVFMTNPELFNTIPFDKVAPVKYFLPTYKSEQECIADVRKIFYDEEE